MSVTYLFPSSSLVSVPVLLHALAPPALVGPPPALPARSIAFPAHACLLRASPGPCHALLGAVHVAVVVVRVGVAGLVLRPCCRLLPLCLFTVPFQLSPVRAVWGRRTKRLGERKGETYEMREGEERRRTGTGRKWTAQMLHAIHLFSFPMVSSLMRKSPSSKLSCSSMLFYVGSPFYGYNYVVEQMNSRAEQLRL